MNTSLILAASSTDFFSTTLGGTIKAFLVAIGVIVVLVSIIKAFGKFMNGKSAGEGIKILVLGFFIAAFCFRPELIDSLIGLVGDLIGQFSDTTSELTNSTTPKG